MSNPLMARSFGPDPEAQITRRWLPLIIGIAIGMRVALGMAHPFTFPDSRDYDQLARAILLGQPYETGQYVATRMPGYPVFVAVVYALSGASQAAVFVAQALLGGATVYLIYLLGRRIGLAVGLLAAFFAAVDPLSVGFSAALLSETPFTFCLVLALWGAVRIRESPHNHWTAWALLGLLWGVAVYMRASALWAVVPILFWVAFFKRNAGFRINLLHALLTLALVFFALSPWQVRNYRLFGSGYFRLTTLEGLSLYEAVYPGADGGPKQTTIPIPTDMLALNEAQKNDAWAGKGWAEIRRDPARIATLAIVKFERTWSPTFNDAEFSARPIQWGMLLWHLPLYLFGFIGLCTIRKTFALLLMIPVAYFSVVHMLFLGSVRYRVPLMPLVCLFAAAGVVNVMKWWFAHKRVPGGKV